MKFRRKSLLIESILILIMCSTLLSLFHKDTQSMLRLGDFMRAFRRAKIAVLSSHAFDS